MIEQLKTLEQSEVNELLDAIPRITVLIAGADEKIDTKETEWAKKIANIRSYASETLLRDYYNSVGAHFEERVSALIKELPDDTEVRTEVLSQHLAKLNPILTKLDNTFAAYLYDSFLSFAKHVAKAAGGFLSFMTISAEEKKLIGLEMIDPVAHPGEE